MSPHPGHNNRDFDAYIELPVKRGQVYSVRKGSVERAKNVGRRPYRAILVEFES